MRTPSTAFALIVFLAGVAQAAPVTFNLSPTHAKKQITFESKTPVEYIEGEVEQIGGSISADFAAPGLGLRASIAVPVRSMRTGIEKRDEHLSSDEWLAADKHPSIRFELAQVNPKKISARGANVWAGTVEGSFFLKGITKNISVPVTITREGNDRVIVEGRFPVKLSDHNVRGPLAMRVIGLKVNEIVQVGFRLVGVKDIGWGNVKKSAPTRPRQKLR